MFTKFYCSVVVSTFVLFVLVLFRSPTLWVIVRRHFLVILNGPSIFKTLDCSTSKGKPLRIYNNTWSFSSWLYLFLNLVLKFSTCSLKCIEKNLVNYSYFGKCPKYEKLEYNQCPFQGTLIRAFSAYFFHRAKCESFVHHARNWRLHVWHFRILGDSIY